MAVWNDIPIDECGEKIVPISPSIKRLNPHPYIKAGAPYPESFNPFMMRKTPAKALEKAQEKLSILHPGFQLMVFDALRPAAVQRYMIALNITLELEKIKKTVDNATPQELEGARNLVNSMWGDPDKDDNNPMPHLTGGAVDLTITTPNGLELPMGCPIDHSGKEVVTDYFAAATSREDKMYHRNRMLLVTIMEHVGFIVNSKEWWHFDMGTQKAVYEHRLRDPNYSEVARYGRYDLVKS